MAKKLAGSGMWRVETYLLLMLANEDVLIVDDHSLKEVFRAGYVLG